MLQPPVSLNDLMREWSKDKIVDGTELEKEILKISHLHGKYLNIMSHHRILFHKMEADYKMLKGLREDYYQGHLTKEEMEERGWEPIQHVLSNPQVARKLDTDTELNKMLLKRVAHGEIVEYCQDVLKSLNSRTWDLGNVIKYRQLTGK